MALAERTIRLVFTFFVHAVRDHFTLWVLGGFGLPEPEPSCDCVVRDRQLYRALRTEAQTASKWSLRTSERSSLLELTSFTNEFATFNCNGIQIIISMPEDRISYCIIVKMDPPASLWIWSDGCSSLASPSLVSVSGFSGQGN